MGQSKSKSKIKYAKLPCPSNGAVISDVDSEDEIDVEIGNLKKRDEKSETPKPLSKAWCIGVGFATISGIIFTFNNTLFKIAGLDYMDTILTRSLLQIALLTFLNYCQKNNYHFGLTKTQGLILIQAFCSAIMIFGSYNCLRFLPIGDAITIMFSSPLFTAILERYIQNTKNSKFNIWRCGCLVLLMAGVIFVAKPAMLFQSETETTANSTVNPLKEDLNKSVVSEVTMFQYMAGVCLALTASLCGAISGITTNELNGKPVLDKDGEPTKEKKVEVKTAVLVWYTGVAQLLICLGCALFDDQGVLIRGNFEQITSEMWFYMSIIAVLGLLAFTTTTIAYKTLDPTMTSFVRSLEIVFAEVIQIFTFHDFPSPSSLTGSILVVISVLAKGGEDHLKPKLAECLPILSEKTDSQPESEEKKEDVKTTTKQKQDMAFKKEHQLTGILNDDWDHGDFSVV